jgi:uncharacterized protein with PIN domain
MADILDAYALIALINDEPAAPLVEEVMRSGEATMTSINLAEAVDVSCRVQGFDERSVRTIVEPLVFGAHLSMPPPSEANAWRAARLRIAYYARRARPLFDRRLLSVGGGGVRRPHCNCRPSRRRHCPRRGS